MISYFSGLFEPFTGALAIGVAFVAILIGFVSLFFGRRLYWLFVGVAGFLLGLIVAPILFINLNPSWQPWITLLLGVIFALLALVLNKFMVALAGAIGVGSLVYMLVSPILLPWAVVLFSIVGAIIGFLVGWYVFEWGLMIFSALAGAALMTSGVVSLIPGIAKTDLIVFLALFIIGMTYQIIQWVRNQKKAAPVEEEESEVIEESN